MTLWHHIVETVWYLYVNDEIAFPNVFMLGNSFQKCVASVAYQVYEQLECNKSFLFLDERYS